MKYKALNSIGDGLVVSRPSTDAQLRLYVKHGHKVEQVAILCGDKEAEKLKDCLMMLGVIKI